MIRSAVPRSIHFLVSLSAIVFAGCRSAGPFPSAVPSVPDSFPNHSVSEILGLLPAMPAAFDTLYAETSVAVSSPEENGRFTTRIAYRRGDSLLVRIRFPLGIEGARVLVASDSAWIYDRVHEEVVFGSVDAVARLLPAVMIGPNMVEDALDFVKPDPAVAWVLSADTLRYHLTTPDSSVRFVVDPTLWRVVHVEYRDREGMVLEQRWYTDFRNINQHVLPLRVIVSRPQEDTRMSMAVREVDTDPGPLSFDLGLKSDTRRIFVR